MQNAMYILKLYLHAQQHGYICSLSGQLQRIWAVLSVLILLSLPYIGWLLNLDIYIYKIIIKTLGSWKSQAGSTVTASLMNYHRQHLTQTTSPKHMVSNRQSNASISCAAKNPNCSTPKVSKLSEDQ